jgi:hypothetical protein
MNYLDPGINAGAIISNQDTTRILGMGHFEYFELANTEF